MLRPLMIALALVAATPVLAFDLPHLTFPEASVATTSTANGK